MQRRPAFLAADRAGFAAGARCDGHVVLVASRQQAVPVGDERQPHVLPTLRHGLGHELLQVRVADETFQDVQIHVVITSPELQVRSSIRQEGEHLHSLFVLADQFGGELAQNLQEGQVDGRKLWSALILVLECKLNSIPDENRDRWSRWRERWRWTEREIKRQAKNVLHMNSSNSKELIDGSVHLNNTERTVVLVQCGHGLSGLDLIQAEGEGEASCQLLDAADVRRRPVQVGSLVLQQLVEQLQHTRRSVFDLTCRDS